MGEVLGIGMTHAPHFQYPDENMADIHRMRLKNEKTPAAMRDPRNWPGQAVRPAAAIVVGSAAAVGLVAVRTQRKRHKRRAASANVFELAERTLRDVAAEARRIADDTPRRH